MPTNKTKTQPKPKKESKPAPELVEGTATERPESNPQISSFRPHTRLVESKGVTFRVVEN